MVITIRLCAEMAQLIERTYMKHKFEFGMLLLALIGSIGLVVYTLMQWAASTDHADRFDWMLLAGVSAISAVMCMALMGRALNGNKS